MELANPRILMAFEITSLVLTFNCCRRMGEQRLKNLLLLFNGLTCRDPGSSFVVAVVTIHSTHLFRKAITVISLFCPAHPPPQWSFLFLCWDRQLGCWIGGGSCGRVAHHQSSLSNKDSRTIRGRDHCTFGRILSASNSWTHCLSKWLLMEVVTKHKLC